MKALFALAWELQPAIIFLGQHPALVTVFILGGCAVLHESQLGVRLQNIFTSRL